jgi:hypothetical protein
VKLKAVIPRERAEPDVDKAIDYYLSEIWRVLHGMLDIPSWMQDPDLT